MQVRLRKPELEKFIAEQVEAGRFESADAVVESAVERLMREGSDELDQETIDAINRAEEQFERGEGIDFARFADEMRKKMSAR